MYRLSLTALKIVVYVLLVQLSLPFIGGAYYGQCGDRGTEQWYLDVSSLAARAIKAVEDGRTKFVMLQASEVESVRAATERFRVAKSQLEAEANAGLAELVARPRRRVKTS